MANLSVTIFFPLEKSKLPQRLEQWSDATDLLNEYYKEPEKYSYYCFSSSGGWNIEDLKSEINFYKVTGLEFIQKEIDWINGEQIERAIDALDKIITGIELNGFAKHPRYEVIPPSESRPIMLAAKPALTNNDDTTDDYCIFLRSLHQALQKAKQKNTGFLFLQTE